MRFLIACLLMLSACHKDEPPAPSADQSAQLNEAEDMLNGMAGDRARNEEGPEDRSSGPSNSSD